MVCPAPALPAAHMRPCSAVHRPPPAPSPPPQIKPPICFTTAQADTMVDAMAAVLGALSAQDKAELAARSAAEVAEIAERHRRLS